MLAAILAYIRNLVYQKRVLNPVFTGVSFSVDFERNLC